MVTKRITLSGKIWLNTFRLLFCNIVCSDLSKHQSADKLTYHIYILLDNILLGWEVGVYNSLSLPPCYPYKVPQHRQYLLSYSSNVHRDPHFLSRLHQHNNCPFGSNLLLRVWQQLVQWVIQCLYCLFLQLYCCDRTNQGKQHHPLKNKITHEIYGKYYRESPMHDSSQLGSKVWKCEGETSTNLFPPFLFPLALYQQALTRHTMTEGPIY